ncbi:MAG: NUDIX hydrolase [Chitinophagales bacterium]|nr:NUDIX hydrolase [Chitinophagales bacterium]
MAQMYKIFVNEIPVVIKEGNFTADEMYNEKNPAFFFTQKKEIQKAFQLIEAGNQYKSLTIIGEDAKHIKNFLFTQYKTIRAAGGFVFNTQKEILMILRHSVWDLPKGKIEEGEKKKTAAVREVREETGIEKVELIKKIMKTYHTYVAAEDQKVLKTTHWYLMQSFDDGDMIPQKEEGIDAVAWANPEQVEEKLRNTYGSIRDVADAGIIAMHLL